jgi:hypothetical protein
MLAFSQGLSRDVLCNVGAELGDAQIEEAERLNNAARDKPAARQ